MQFASSERVLNGWVRGAQTPHPSTHTKPAPARNRNPADSTAAVPGVNYPLRNENPLAMKQALSTRKAQEGDTVYAKTTFHRHRRQGLWYRREIISRAISHVRRAAGLTRRAEYLMHFTSMIYPNGYTVMLRVHGDPRYRERIIRRPRGRKGTTSARTLRRAKGHRDVAEHCSPGRARGDLAPAARRGHARQRGRNERLRFAMISAPAT